ncbi:MAG: MarR family transcriptional regulator [Anaerolineae bacterium]|nr:MarR family transcriptional regulator [Anaerolineae bacterium]
MSEIRDIWLHAHNMIRSARQIINRDLYPLGLSSAEGNILLHMWTQGKEMGQEQLVDQLDISKAAVSRALDSLERKGYITREPSPEDKRAHWIQLTSTAAEIGPRIEQIYNRVFTLAVQGISHDELDFFMRLFSRISENFAREQAMNT